MWGRKAAAWWVSLQHQRCRWMRKGPQPHRSRVAWWLLFLQKIQNNRRALQHKWTFNYKTANINTVYALKIIHIHTYALMLIDSKFLQYFSQTMKIFAIRTFVIRFLLTVFEICFYLLITTAEWQHIVHNIYLDYNVSVWVWTITVVSYRGQYLTLCYWFLRQIALWRR